MLEFTAAARNVHSQYGEDGVLAWTLDQLGISSGSFVEFGAWDGVHLSNCRYLFEQGWRGCLIEGDSDRFRDLERTYHGETRAKLVCAFVETSGVNSLDSLLERAGIESVDLASIDIDSDDYAVWKSLTRFRPRVVIIEYNPTIPFDTRYVNPPGKNRGNSALSLVELGLEKGYDLVAGTRGNLVFVDSNDRPTKLDAISLQSLKDAVGGGFRFFFGMDGTFLREAGHTIRETEVYRVPWTDYMAAQPLPRFLRHFDSRSRLKKIVGAVLLLITRPFSAIRMAQDQRTNPRPAERQIYEEEIGGGPDPQV
ncbi:MAG: hypothetical protein HKN29_01950 [Rhodothermales bacterium]|nr:hypothetical protein [Rhodothermales bacterium]